MIGKLTGIVDSIGEDHVILDVGGVGYLIHCPNSTLSKLGTGSSASLMTEMRLTDETIRLYGFSSGEEREWFRLLQTVQNVGARVALNVLSALTGYQVGADRGDRLDDPAVHATVDDAVGLEMLRADSQLGADLVPGGDGDFQPHRLGPALPPLVHLRREVAGHVAIVVRPKIEDRNDPGRLTKVEGLARPGPRSSTFAVLPPPTPGAGFGKGKP